MSIITLNQLSSALSKVRTYFTSITDLLTESVESVVSRQEIVEQSLSEISEDISTASTSAESASASATAAAASASSAASYAEYVETTMTEAAEVAAAAVASELSEYMTSTEANAILAQSYAVGGTGTRDNEDADNAKYYSDLIAQMVLEDFGFSFDDEGYLVQDTDYEPSSDNDTTEE